jgi:hypothetical protein
MSEILHCLDQSRFNDFCRTMVTLLINNNTGTDCREKKKIDQQIVNEPEC